MSNRIISLAAAALLFSACGKNQEPAAQPQQQPQEAALPAAAPAGKNAAAYVKKDTYFRLPAARGGEIDLAAYAGKPVLLIFFTETCPYCRKAAPFMQKAASAYGPKGLNTIGICTQDSPQAARNFAADFGLTFPLAYGGKEIAANYRTRGVPYIYLLTKEHEIYDVWEGYDEKYDPSILQAIETVLAKK
jgi:peroxiredoxin